ncbi:hypothetical protein ATK36_1572 [Amycolatopsis sulphurea]|uniref:Uncharacterized protein n=1 Tax=Amycolatopsis sulphurea TaxID=76022 RepID=A0A2A9F5I2_9PSEU|nr:hypothetical protein [Amycolatopsis sulphurea]PFG46584.1 hypothetical protein ATK36_1572 [Amycolatopsis sulphurea]
MTEQTLPSISTDEAGGTADTHEFIGEKGAAGWFFVRKRIDLSAFERAES